MVTGKKRKKEEEKHSSGLHNIDKMSLTRNTGVIHQGITFESFLNLCNSYGLSLN
jgi:hypothetical protein